MKHVLVCLLCLLPIRAVAGPADDLARALAAVTGIEDRAALRAAAEADLRPLDAGTIETAVPLAVAMGEMAATAEHPATRAALTDLHRQMTANLVAAPDESEMLALLERANPMEAEIHAGLGMARSDVLAAAYLEALAATMPEDPGAAGLDRDSAQQTGRRVAELFAGERPANRQFLSRLDAWLAGTLAAWPDLDTEERRAAASVVFVDALPPPEVIEAVTGTTDILGWIGAMELTFTEAERDAAPEMVAFLEAGNMTGGATEDLVARMELMGMAGAGAAGVTTMMELNYQLLFDDLSGPSVAGDLMGLE